MVEYSAGIVTAYGAAVRGGYTGTYEEFCRQQAQYADNAEAVEQAKQTAVSNAQVAYNAAQTAGQANTQAQAASTAAQSASQLAGQSAQDAQTAESNASTHAQNAASAAGSAQASAAAAQAVKDSIPSDYTELSSDVDQLKADLDALDSKVDNVKISDPVKEALLACFEHVALWTEGEGKEYIDVLRAALGSIYPDLSTGNIISNYYYGSDGNMVASNHSYCNEKYFEIENGTDYYWIQGFDGAVGGVKPDYTASMNAYRVCYYDENKDFISRQINNDYSSEFGVIEPRYMKLTIPTGAKYFRVSWKYLPCGVICKTIPTNLYAVTIVLANLDDSEISNNSDIVSRFSVTRKGTDITQLAKTGIPNVTPEDSFELYGGWLRNVFSVLSGGSPEYGNQNLETMTRIHNKHTYIMRKGDVISFDNVKAGVRAERISDGEVQHNTAWITDNSDFVVGGES